MKALQAILWIFLSTAFGCPVNGQTVHYTMENAHSHNDYEQSAPFYDAYSRHFGSIEADVWALNGTLYVAHSRDKITADRTFRKLYLLPLIRQLKANKGVVYKNKAPFQLLIDLKSSYTQVLPLLFKALRPYRKYFDFSHNAHAVRIVISGNMPPPDSLDFFDPVFTFDGRLGNHYPPEDLRRVKLVSADVQDLVSWRADSALGIQEQAVLHKVIDSVHHEHKLIRFWGTPNNDHTYNMLMQLCVDYIGTDSLAKMESFIEGRNKE